MGNLPTNPNSKTSQIHLKNIIIIIQGKKKHGKSMKTIPTE
jgi:hypothetical protein